MTAVQELLRLPANSRQTGWLWAFAISSFDQFFRKVLAPGIQIFRYLRVKVMYVFWKFSQ